MQNFAGAFLSLFFLYRVMFCHVEYRFPGSELFHVISLGFEFSLVCVHIFLLLYYTYVYTHIFVIDRNTVQIADDA